MFLLKYLISYENHLSMYVIEITIAYICYYNIYIYNKQTMPVQINKSSFSNGGNLTHKHNIDALWAS